MASTTFTNGITLTEAAWFNDVDTVTYTYFGDGTNLNSPTQVAVTIGTFSTRVGTPIVDSISGTLVLKGAGTTAITITGNDVVMADSVVWGTGVANFGTITKRKTADESVTSSTTLQDDDHLTFSIAANEEWIVDYDLIVGDAVSFSGYKTAITGPSGASYLAMFTAIGDGANQSQVQQDVTLGNAISFTTTSFSSSSILSVAIHARIVNGATPGNVTLQFAQQTSSGSAVKNKNGSGLVATRVA